MLDISYYNHPPESATYSKVQCERSAAIGSDRGVVDSLKGEVVSGTSSSVTL